MASQSRVTNDAGSDTLESLQQQARRAGLVHSLSTRAPFSALPPATRLAPKFQPRSQQTDQHDINVVLSLLASGTPAFDGSEDRSLLSSLGDQFSSDSTGLDAVQEYFSSHDRDNSGDDDADDADEYADVESIDSDDGITGVTQETATSGEDEAPGTDNHTKSVPQQTEDSTEGTEEAGDIDIDSIFERMRAIQLEYGKPKVFVSEESENTGDTSAENSKQSKDKASTDESVAHDDAETRVDSEEDSAENIFMGFAQDANPDEDDVHFHDEDNVNFHNEWPDVAGGDGEVGTDTEAAPFLSPARPLVKLTTEDGSNFGSFSHDNDDWGIDDVNDHNPIKSTDFEDGAFDLPFSPDIEDETLQILRERPASSNALGSNVGDNLRDLFQ